MLKSCSRCGRIHPYGYVCGHHIAMHRTEDDKLRRTYRWQQKSLEIRDRAQHLCEVCRDKGRYVYNGLEVHHIEKLRDRPDLLLDDENLICLCQECHKKADDGGMSKDYLIELARKREGRIVQLYEH